VGLHAGHLDSQDTLRLGGQRLDNVLLEPSKHDVLDVAVQLLDLLLLVGVVEVEVVRQSDCNGKVAWSVETSRRKRVFVTHTFGA
jgi:hypothetical protein